MASAVTCNIMLPKLFQMLLSNMQNRQKKKKKLHMNNKDRRFSVLAATRDILGQPYICTLLYPWFLLSMESDVFCFFILFYLFIYFTIFHTTEFDFAL